MPKLIGNGGGGGNIGGGSVIRFVPVVLVAALGFKSGCHSFGCNTSLESTTEMFTPPAHDFRQDAEADEKVKDAARDLLKDGIKKLAEPKDTAK